MRTLFAVLLLAIAAVAAPFKIHHVVRHGEPEREVRVVANIWFTGAVGDTDWDTGANWSGGSPPSDGDNVSIDSRAGSDLLLNLDRTGDTAGQGLDLGVLHIDPSTTVTVGSTAAPLKCLAAVVKNRSSGSFFFQSKSGTDADSTLRVIQDGSGYFEISSSGSGKGGIVTLELLRGIGLVTLNSTVAMTNLHVLSRTPSVTATFSGVSDFADAYFEGGDIAWNMTNTTSVITRMYQTGGVFTYNSGSILLLRQFGGTFVMNQTATSQLLTVMGYSGVFDATRTPGQKDVTDMYRDSDDGSFLLLDDNRLFSITGTDVIFGQ